MTGKEYTINGVDIEMFPIGELSRQLDRQRQTIRKWEKAGIIPQAVYRSGADRRLYTRRQIEAIVKVVREYDIKQGYRIPAEFREDVREAFEKATQEDFE